MNSRRFGLIAVIAAAILAAAVCAGAQHTRKAPRVGVLVLTPRASVGGAYVDALQHGLRELGYVEGQTIVLDIRWAEGKPDRLAGLALDLVNSKIDVLVTSGTEAIQAARETGRGVPIVMATVVDPVALGFAASLARPGGNLTGLAILSPELIGKRLQLFKETVPSALKVGAIWNPANEANVLMLAAAETAARALGIELLAVPVRRPDQLRPAFAALVDGRARGLVVFEDSMLVSHTQEIVGLAARSRLPAMYAFRSLVEDGGLMSYGPHLLDLWHRAAAYVDKILKGARPGDLPVEQPTRFELVVNVRTAKALGLTIPQSILLRADHVIEGASP